MLNNNRRGFVKILGALLSTLLVRCKGENENAEKNKKASAPNENPVTTQTQTTAPVESPRKLIDPESNPTAKALKYVSNADNAQERQNKSAFCSNCQYYTEAESLNGSAVGKCQLIPGGLVEAGGWCTSWIEKVQK